MEIIIEKFDSGTKMILNGRLDASNSNDTENTLFKLIENQEKNVIIDCKNLDYISSSGLRVFLVALKKLAANDGRMILCEMNENIQQIFEISGFSKIFKIVPNIEEALKNL